MYSLTMGEISRLFNIKKSTVRYYVDEGLLTPKKNNQNDYYVFLEEDIYRLYQILILKESGISIRRIKHSFNHESVFDLFYEAKKDIKNKINALTHIESKLNEIIQDNKKYILNENVFIEYPSRYLEEVPSDYLENNNFLYSKITSQNVDYFNYLNYVFTNKRNFFVCVQSTKEKYSFVYPEGLYASKTVVAIDEQDLLDQIDLFMSDSLFKQTDTNIEKLLVYENIHCSLAYSEKMIFTMEVKM